MQESISRVLALRFVNAKDLASVAGQLNSMFLVIGNIVRLMSRSMYAQILAQNSWFSNFYLEDSVVEELVFWQSNLDHLNSSRIWFKSSAVRVAYSDAIVTPDMAVTFSFMCFLCGTRHKAFMRKHCQLE